jgi:hypothetical protein
MGIGARAVSRQFLPYSPNGPRNIYLVTQGGFHFSGGIVEHQSAKHYLWWVLVRLEDGKVSKEAFETRDAALRSVHNERYYAPYKVPYDAFTPPIADVVLAYLRRVFDSGVYADRADPRTPIFPSRLF